jgi:signal transduction histidine kinase/ActR/RegA family two-component response regulator
MPLYPNPMAESGVDRTFDEMWSATFGLSVGQPDRAPVPVSDQASLVLQLWVEQQLSELRAQLDRQLYGHQSTPGDLALELLQILAETLAQALGNESLALVIPTETAQLYIHSLHGAERGTAPEAPWKLGQPLDEAELQRLQSADWQQAWPLLDWEGPIGWLIVQPGPEVLGNVLGSADRRELRAHWLSRAVDAAMGPLQQARRQRQQAQQDQELQVRNQELIQISQLKSEFLANTSHEIRTPLSSILGFTHLLREQGFTPGSLRHQEYLRIILTSGQHLLALINDILDLSKIEANQLDLQPEPIDVAELCRTVFTLVQEKANDKGLTLQLELTPDLPSLWADPLRLKQMLFNLLSNALKFTQSGTVGLRVHPAPQSQLRLTVWDTGVGIPTDQQNLLFKPYQQLPHTSTRSSEGTGLGLALTQKLAELHGGWVEVRSEKDQGSQFCIVLPMIDRRADGRRADGRRESPAPAAPVALTKQPERRRSERRSNPAANPELSLTVSTVRSRRIPQPLRSYHLLLVEDNPHNAHLVITYLCKLGYEVTWAKDGGEMWRSLQQSLPAAILMDVSLPEVDGLSLIRQLREHKKYKGLPIVVQTAMAMTGDREICIEAGADDYIPKPIDWPRLVAALKRFSDPAAQPEQRRSGQRPR